MENEEAWKNRQSEEEEKKKKSNSLIYSFYIEAGVGVALMVEKTEKLFFPDTNEIFTRKHCFQGLLKEIFMLSGFYSGGIQRNAGRHVILIKMLVSDIRRFTYHYYGYITKEKCHMKYELLLSSS